MHESTQLNGTNIVPNPPPPLPLIVGLQQLKGLALVYPVHIRAHNRSKDYFEKSTSHCIFVLTSTEVAAQHEM